MKPLTSSELYSLAEEALGVFLAKPKMTGNDLNAYLNGLKFLHTLNKELEGNQLDSTVFTLDLDSMDTTETEQRYRDLLIQRAVEQHIEKAIQDALKEKGVKDWSNYSYTYKGTLNLTI